MADNNRWISVATEGFPPYTDKHYYWLYHKSNNSYNIGEYDYISNHFQDTQGERLYNVSHWMKPYPPDNNSNDNNTAT